MQKQLPPPTLQETTIWNPLEKSRCSQEWFWFSNWEALIATHILKGCYLINMWKGTEINVCFFNNWLLLHSNYHIKCALIMFDAEHHGFLSPHCCVHAVLWEKILALPKDQNMKTIYSVHNTAGQGINFIWSATSH